MKLDLSNAFKITMPVEMIRGGKCKMDVWYNSYDNDIEIRAITFPNDTKHDVRRLVKANDNLINHLTDELNNIEEITNWKN